MIKKREYEFIGKNVILICDDVFPLYLISGEKNCLIDCAVTAKSEELYGKINKLLKQTENLRSREINMVCLTHSHYDHTGMGSYLQNFYDFTVYGSLVTVNLLKKKKVVDFINHLNQVFKKELKDTSDIQFTGLRNLQPLKEGDRLEVDKDNYVEILETPGHTRCSLSYLLMPDRILFPGDSVGIMEKDQSINPLFLSNYGRYMDSLHKIRKIEAEYLCFAHNRYLKGKDKIKNFMDRTLARTELFKNTILKHLNNLENKEEIAEKIYREEYPVPTIMGPRETLLINISAMINVIEREFLG